jgi:hypothetical protein
MWVPTFRKKILPPSSDYHEDAVHPPEMLEARYKPKWCYNTGDLNEKLQSNLIYIY